MLQLQGPQRSESRSFFGEGHLVKIYVRAGLVPTPQVRRSCPRTTHSLQTRRLAQSTAILENWKVMTRLWTIQSHPFFERVANKGEHHASWEYVSASWRKPFEWMAQQTAKRLGQPPNGHPPVWAWHSCGAWQSAPNVDDFHALCGLDPQPHLQLQIATLEVDESDYCLSYYGPWCDLIITEHSRFEPVPELVDQLWFVDSNSSKIPFDPHANYHDLQATMLSLRAEQVLRIDSTQSFFGSW